MGKLHDGVRCGAVNHGHPFLSRFPMVLRITGQIRPHPMAHISCHVRIFLPIRHRRHHSILLCLIGLFTTVQSSDLVESGLLVTRYSRQAVAYA